MHGSCRLCRHVNGKSVGFLFYNVTRGTSSVYQHVIGAVQHCHSDTPVLLDEQEGSRGFTRAARSQAQREIPGGAEALAFD